jgi:hypothetical protein
MKGYYKCCSLKYGWQGRTPPPILGNPTEKVAKPARIRNCLFALVLVANPLTSGRVAANMHDNDGKLSAQTFLVLLKRVIGDGDLRDLDRFSNVLQAKISLQPFYIDDGSSHRRLGGVRIIPETAQKPFAPPLFEFKFGIQDSVPVAPSLLGSGKTIATMSITGMKDVDCVTREDIIREFGSPKSEALGPPGAGVVMTYLVADSRKYQTELGVNIPHNETCVALIVLRQSSH